MSSLGCLQEESLANSIIASGDLAPFGNGQTCTINLALLTSTCSVLGILAMQIVPVTLARQNVYIHGARRSHVLKRIPVCTQSVTFETCGNTFFSQPPPRQATPPHSLFSIMILQLKRVEILLTGCAVYAQDHQHVSYYLVHSFGTFFVWGIKGMHSDSFTEL